MTKLNIPAQKAERPNFPPGQGGQRAAQLLIAALFATAALAQSARAAAPTSKVDFDMSPLARLYLDMRLLSGFHTDCTGHNASYVGPLSSGVPEGIGEIIPDCDIPVEIGIYALPEACLRCSTVRRWHGYFVGGDLAVGTLETVDGWRYEGPLFNLLPRGVGVVTTPDGQAKRERFSFGRRRDRE